MRTDEKTKTLARRGPGRRRSLTTDQEHAASEMLRLGMAPAVVARLYGCFPRTVGRAAQRVAERASRMSTPEVLAIAQAIVEQDRADRVFIEQWVNPHPTLTDEEIAALADMSVEGVTETIERNLDRALGVVYLAQWRLGLTPESDALEALEWEWVAGGMERLHLIERQHPGLLGPELLTVFREREDGLAVS